MSSRRRWMSFALIWAGAAGLLPGAAAGAQERGLELELRDRELEYAAALSEWESALDAFRAAEARWQRALDQVREAEDSGDEAQLGPALARFHTQALELENQESRQEETARALTDARNGLMEMLALSRDALYEDALDDATPPEQRRELAALIQDRTNRYRALEQEEAPPAQVRVVSSPEIVIDPRDGPDELNAKIRFMELRIRQMEDDIESVSARIETLRKEQRQQRDLQNLMAGVNRFDDISLPVTNADPLSNTADREQGDSPPQGAATVDSLDELSTDQQIEGLLLLQEQMFDRIERMEIRAETFRQRLMRLTTS